MKEKKIIIKREGKEDEIIIGENAEKIITFLEKLKKTKTDFEEKIFNEHKTK
jgi:hypothetical protein